MGCWVHSSDKHGRDVGELIGREPIGVIAANSAEKILALDGDCVLYIPLLPNPLRYRRCWHLARTLSPRWDGSTQAPTMRKSTGWHDKHR